MGYVFKEVVNSPISDNILDTFQGLPSPSPPPTNREAQAAAAARTAHTARTAGGRRPQPMQFHPTEGTGGKVHTGQKSH